MQQGTVGLFTPSGNLMIFLGIVIGIIEGMIRFKSELTSTGDVEDARYGASIYGWFASLVATPLLIGLRSTLVNDDVGLRKTMPGAVETEGAIYSDDIKERYRRYGMVNNVSELADYFRIEIEFPRWVPDSSAKNTYDLPDRMPHYDYEVSISSPYAPDDTFPQFRECSDRSNPAPPGILKSRWNLLILVLRRWSDVPVHSLTVSEISFLYRANQKTFTRNIKIGCLKSSYRRQGRMMISL